MEATPIGPINLSLKLRYAPPASAKPKKWKWAERQQRYLWRRWGDIPPTSIANYWRVYDGPARNILETERKS
jgi:hypothetical protein